MHGCLSRPKSIVLTRESYLRYEERNAALAGIVQAMLITRQMLFLGFSLTDDNFHRIIDAVRRAIRPEGGEASQGPFAQALMLERNPHLRELWSKDIDWIDLASARELEIFLDRVGCEAAQPTFLFDQKYASLLSEPDRRLKEALARFADGEASYHGSFAWPQVEGLLQGLGWKVKN